MTGLNDGSLRHLIVQAFHYPRLSSLFILISQSAMLPTQNGLGRSSTVLASIPFAQFQFQQRALSQPGNAAR